MRICFRKKFLSFAAFISILLCMMTFSAFAAEPSDMDFTNATGNESGTGWTWENATKTLSLNNATIAVPITLPENAVILVPDGTDNTIAPTDVNAITTSGELTIRGKGSLTITASVDTSAGTVYETIEGATKIIVDGTKLTASGRYGLKAESISISGATLKIDGLEHGISLQTSSARSLSALIEDSTGTINGAIYNGIDVYSEIGGGDLSVTLKNCDGMTISGNTTDGGNSGNYLKSGIRLYTLSRTADATVTITDCDDLKIFGAASGVTVNCHSDNSENESDNGAASLIIYNSSVTAKAIKTTYWTAFFLNNNNTGDGGTCNIDIQNSTLFASCPGDVSIMTSTKKAASIINVKNSAITLEAPFAGFRAKAISSNEADIFVEESIIVSTINTSGYKVIDEMDKAASKDATFESLGDNCTVITPIGDSKINVDENGGWSIPAGSTVSINNKAYQFDTKTSLDANGTPATPGTRNCDAEIDGVEYPTLKGAIDAANSAGKAVTIHIVRDIVFAQKYDIKGNITIDAENGKNDFSLTRNTTYTGSLFTVNANAELTLQNIIIDGGNEWVFNKAAYQEDLKNYTIGGYDKYVTSQEGAPIATKTLIQNNKTLNILGGSIFKNHFGKPIVTVAKGAVTNIEGAIFTHNTQKGSGLIVYSGVHNAVVNVKNGTLIENNHVGANHGLFRMYYSTLNMSGGMIRNNTGNDANGVVAGFYSGANLPVATFNFSGGTICSNSSVYSGVNGRLATIYLHQFSAISMRGGTICHNEGGSAAGIDGNPRVTDIILDGGTILNNTAHTPNFEHNSGIRFQVSAKVEFGENMNVQDNVSLMGPLTNKGTIVGNVIVSDYLDTENGTIDGNVTLVMSAGADPSTTPDQVIRGMDKITGTISVEYVPASNQYSVTYVYNGGMDAAKLAGSNVLVQTEIDSENVRVSKTATKEELAAPTLTLDKHIFCGWYADEALTQPVDLTKDYTLTEDVTFYAKWIPQYSAVFIAENAEVASVSFAEGDTELIFVPAVPAKSGYTGAWEAYILGAEDITIRAIYTLITYTVAYDANGGTGAVVSQTMTYDTEDHLNRNAFVRPSYSFKCWNTKPDGTGDNYAAGAAVKNLTDTQQGTVTLYAQWARVTHTAYLMVDGEVYDQIIFAEGDTTLNLPEVPAKSGYTGAWEAYTLGAEDITVHAVYTNAYVPPTRYTVCFCADHRLWIIRYRKGADELTVVPKVPEKEGYIGAWEEYELNDKNIVVRAVYTKK